MVGYAARLGGIWGANWSRSGSVCRIPSDYERCLGKAGARFLGANTCAQRRYRWYKPRTIGSATTRPRSGGSTAGGWGYIVIERSYGVFVTPPVQNHRKRLGWGGSSGRITARISGRAAAGVGRTWDGHQPSPLPWDSVTLNPLIPRPLGLISSPQPPRSRLCLTGSQLVPTTDPR